MAVIRKPPARDLSERRDPLENHLSSARSEKRGGGTVSHSPSERDNSTKTWPQSETARRPFTP